MHSQEINPATVEAVIAADGENFKLVIDCAETGSEEFRVPVTRVRLPRVRTLRENRGQRGYSYSEAGLAPFLRDMSSE